MIAQLGQLTFDEILARMNDEGQFTTTVLAGDDGLLVAAAPTPSPYSTDTLAAMVALVKGFIQETQSQLGLAKVDEVSILVDDRSRLICRYFTAEDRPLVLATIAPPDRPYRRLTTRTIHQIAKAWGK
jgi:predicted regulator of Ras-like GTPase activity (Roadblock/LC7/MglB family)